MSLLETVMSLDFTPFWISFKLSFITTVILFFIALPISWWLSQTKNPIKPFVEAITTLPLVLPPTVLGFYILVAFSPNISPIGIFLEQTFSIRLVFNFTALIIASCIYSLPFMVQPLQSGFENLNKNMLEASYISGKSVFVTLFRVALPNIVPSLLTALIITFAHTMGEFGVVLLVGGSIEGDTRVASIAIYEAFESSNFKLAHVYSGIMILMSFAVLLTVYVFNRKQRRLKQGFLP
ncbi:MAG: molybdate ABC transporter permease subunit [Campylobacteraceae bacterium]|jgi:molybdate transport system permease protein|nr:molybdate ABC transporter permease subunit [Campylobacteraceae bacterium]